MCLILFAIEQHPDYPLVVIANRDEFYARPTRSAPWWDDHPHIFAGRDLQAQGTWMGVDRMGRFAAVTNVREPGMKQDAALSRGDLPSNFLQGRLSAQDYIEELQDQMANYAGFNLFIADDSGCWFASNRSSGITEIPAGFFGISNGRFDEPWPKLESGKRALQQNLRANVDADNLLMILANSDQAHDEALPNTGVPIETERLLSSRFIHSSGYGTRASSVLLKAPDRISFTERNFDHSGIMGDAISETIVIDS